MATRITVRRFIGFPLLLLVSIDPELSCARCSSTVKISAPVGPARGGPAWRETRTNVTNTAHGRRKGTNHASNVAAGLSGRDRSFRNRTVDRDLHELRAEQGVWNLTHSHDRLPPLLIILSPMHCS